MTRDFIRSTPTISFELHPACRARGSPTSRPIWPGNSSARTVGRCAQGCPYASAYAIEDLLFQDACVQQAVDQLLAGALSGVDRRAPIRHDGQLFNAAIAIHQGNILGVVPKTICQTTAFRHPPAPADGSRSTSTILTFFRLANKNGASVVGTGDLSELALGWCTYGVGDQMSHYNVSVSVAKTKAQRRWVM